MARKTHILGVLVAVIALGSISASGAQALNFTSARYPATATGSATGNVFDAFGSSILCTETTLSTSSLAGPSASLSATVTNGGCSAFGSLPMTVDMKSCYFIFTSTGKVHIECTTAGDEITATIYANSARHAENQPMCIVHIPPQTELGTVSYTNSANGTVTVSGTVSGITATQTRNSILCPSGTSTTAAKYTIQSGGIVMTGNNGAISID